MRGPLFVFAQPVAHALQRAALPFPTVGREDALRFKRIVAESEEMSKLKDGEAAEYARAIGV